jgi:polar amino acid transport system substrate-binding protein
MPKIYLTKENKMKKNLTFLLVIILCVAIFSGCQSKTETTSTTFEKIQESGEMTFAMTGAYPPFNFIDEGGELAGFDIDIANALAKEMGVKAVPITTAWDGILGSLMSKRIDTIIGSMAITEKRLEQVDFSNPYYYDGAQFFASTDSELTNIEALTDGTVGVVTGTTFHEALIEMENISDIMQFESDVDNFMALEQGRTDGLVTGKFVGLQAPEKYNVDIKPVGSMLYAEEIGIAIRKDDDDLLIAVNDSLNTIIENGTYEEISNKWFGINILSK